MHQSILPLALVPISLTIVVVWRRLRHAALSPPGPKGHWLSGNASDLTGAQAFWLKLSEYAEQYGPFISIRLFTQRLYVVSDPNLVAELFEKRAANYSHREMSQMLKMIGWDNDLITIQYGSTHKRYRAMLNRVIGSNKVSNYLPRQQHEMRKFMRRIRDEPEHFMDHCRLLMAGLVIRIAYGYKVDSFSDQFVQTAVKHTQGFGDTSQPWRWAVNLAPVLRYIPIRFQMAPFQRRVAELRQVFDDHREKPFSFVKQQIATGTAERSFVSEILQNEDGSPVDEQTEHDVKNVASTFYTGGSDTTTSIIQSFFLAMTLYPEAQARAQEEIAEYRRGLSTEQDPPSMILPFDQPNLPYTSALVRELLRWHPVLNMIIRTVGDEDDHNVVYQDKVYHIPARSIVVSNIWQMTHDPRVYSEPDRFMPERYLGPNPPPDPGHYVFGFGRRRCPGIHIAHQSMWMAISNLLLNFTVTKARLENGEEITPPECYTNETTSHPVPFACKIKPREGCKERLEEPIE